MHVAMLIGALTKGGSERVLVNLTQYLLEKGHQVTLVTQYKKENEYPLPDGANRILSDITADEMGNNRIDNFYRRFCKLKSIWRSEKPDVILSFIGKNNIMALLTTRRFHIPVLVSVRGDPMQEYYTSWMRLMARTLFKKASRVILQTNQAMDFFPEKIKRKAVILKNPVNTAFFKPYYQGEREKKIVAVGRVDENKNHMLLIQAFANIAMQFPEYSLYIYGDGESREKLIQWVLEHELSHRIHLPGSVDHIEDMIDKASVYVLSSNTEGVPNTLIEAMLLGLPVIATDCPCGGPAELISQGINGILTPVNNLDKMTENLQKLLNNLQYAVEMGEEASKIQELYRPEIIYQSWEKCLQNAVKPTK